MAYAPMLNEVYYQPQHGHDKAIGRKHNRKQTFSNHIGGEAGSGGIDGMGLDVDG